MKSKTLGVAVNYNKSEEKALEVVKRIIAAGGEAIAVVSFLLWCVTFGGMKSLGIAGDSTIPIHQPCCVGRIFE